MNDLKVYDLRSQGNMDWASIVLRDRGNGYGQIFINSDYGDWCFTWTSMGKSLREFLIIATRDVEYIKSKLGKRDYFDSNKTQKSIITKIIEERRSHNLDKSNARDLYDYTVQYLRVNSEIEFHTALLDGLSIITEWFYSLELYCEKSFQPGLNMFFDRIWPLLIDQLKSELQERVEL